MPFAELKSDNFIDRRKKGIRKRLIILLRILFLKTLRIRILSENIKYPSIGNMCEEVGLQKSTEKN